MTPTPSDKERSFASYLKSARRGDAWAQYCVSCMYYIGKGVEKDELKAEKWLRKSAAQGYPEARKQLKVLFPAENGTPKLGKTKRVSLARKVIAIINRIPWHKLRLKILSLMAGGKKVSKSKSSAIRKAIAFIREIPWDMIMYHGMYIVPLVVLFILLLILVNVKILLFLLFIVIIAGLFGGMFALIAVSAGTKPLWPFVIGTILFLLIFWASFSPGSRYSEPKNPPGNREKSMPQRDRNFSDALKNKRNELSK